MTRVALDSNILAYLAGVNRAPADSGKIAAIRTLIEQLEPNVSFVVPVQALANSS